MRIAAALVTIAMVASCGQSGGNDQGGNGQQPDNSVPPNAAELPRNMASASGQGAGGGMQLQPGEWETTVALRHEMMPNAPNMQPVTWRTCLTPQMAANANPDTIGGDRQEREQEDCQRDYSYANGRIQGTVICTRPGDTTRAVTTGRFTPTSSEETVRIARRQAGTTYNSTMRISRRRIGDCPAG